MTREIKFRCWNTASECMYPNEDFALTMDGDELQLMPQCEHYDKPYLPNAGNMIYMQYTGLKDKNGKEIYEGDVVRTEQFDALALVEWTDFLAQFSVMIRNYDSDDPDDFTFESEGIDPNKEVEVVGNIYESPKLLEANK